MDLSKKTLIGALIAFTCSAITGAIVIFMRADMSQSNEKTTEVFLLIFALAALVLIGATTFIMHRDMALEKVSVIILSALFVISLFALTAAAIDIDYFNNPMSGTISNGKAFLVLPGIASIFEVPALVGAGYLLAQ